MGTPIPPPPPPPPPPPSHLPGEMCGPGCICFLSLLSRLEYSCCLMNLDLNPTESDLRGTSSIKHLCSVSPIWKYSLWATPADTNTSSSTVAFVNFITLAQHVLAIKLLVVIKGHVGKGLREMGVLHKLLGFQQRQTSSWIQVKRWYINNSKCTNFKPAVALHNHCNHFVASFPGLPRSFCSSVSVDNNTRMRT